MHTDGIGAESPAHNADDAKENVIRNREELGEVVPDLKAGRAGKERSRRTSSHAANRHAAKAQQGDNQARNIGRIASGILNAKAR